MKSEEAHSKIRSALRAELKRRHGQIGQIESELNRSEGYLSRFCRGDMEISLKGLLDALDILEIEPESFFGTSLGSVCSSIAYLKECEGFGPYHKGLASIEEALEQMADVSPCDSPCDTVQRLHTVCLEEFLSQPLSVQARRLKTSKKYRQPDFAWSLLRHLDELRYRDAEGAAKTATILIESVLPELHVPREERWRFVCRALGIYSSAIRLTGEHTSAVRAARVGLELAVRFGLDAERVELLERSSYALRDLVRPKAAAAILREALETAFDLDDDLLVGRVLVARGIIYAFEDRTDAASRTFRRALEVLPENEESVSRWRLAAYQNLGVLYTNLADLDAAIRCFASAAKAYDGDRSGTTYAKLLWQKGSIELLDDRYAAAEESLRQAQSELERCESPDLAMVTIDLVKCLMAQGKRNQAIEMAKKMATLVGAFEKNELLQAAVMEFLRIVLQGHLTEAVIDEYRRRLGKMVKRAV